MLLGGDEMLLNILCSVVWGRLTISDIPVPICRRICPPTYPTAVIIIICSGWMPHPKSLYHLSRQRTLYFEGSLFKTAFFVFNVNHPHYRLSTPTTALFSVDCRLHFSWRPKNELCIYLENLNIWLFFAKLSSENIIFLKSHLPSIYFWTIGHKRRSFWIDVTERSRSC